MREEIRKLRKNIVRSIAHAICYGKLASEDFDTALYIRECHLLFTQLGVNDKYTSQILLQGVIQGSREYSMIIQQGGSLVNVLKESNINGAHAASQVHPSMSPMTADIEELGFLCEELEGVIT